MDCIRQTTGRHQLRHMGDRTRWREPMKRGLLALAVTATALTAGCGEPLVVLGDQPGFMRIVAGVANGVGTRVDSIATVARLTSPAGLAVLPSGDLLIVDHSRRIMSVTAGGRLRLLYAGPECTDNNCLFRAQGVTLQGTGALLIADNQTDRI